VRVTHIAAIGGHGGRPDQDFRDWTDGSARKRRLRAAQASAHSRTSAKCASIQALGASVIGAGTLFFLGGAMPIGWLLVGVVVALQVLLATTGICVGCRLYFLRWWVPVQFARLLGRTDALASLTVRGPLRKPDGRG